MNKKSKRPRQEPRDPADAPEITRKWVDSSNLYHGKRLVRRCADGFVAQPARMPNVGEHTDFARDQNGRSTLIERGRMIMAKMSCEPFNASAYLDNENVIAAYLTAAVDDPNPEVFVRALLNVAKARGIAKVAKDSGLGRRVLQKALVPGEKPAFETVHKLVNALGGRWAVVPPTLQRLPRDSRALGEAPARHDAFSTAHPARAAGASSRHERGSCESDSIPEEPCAREREGARYGRDRQRGTSGRCTRARAESVHGTQHLTPGRSERVSRSVLGGGSRRPGVPCGRSSRARALADFEWLTPAAAAKALGVTRARISHIRRGKTSKLRFGPVDSSRCSQG
jgi:probable addiction module antidote protein